ncbi:surfeit locus protein 6 [Phlyctema vagabunda]|uniref:Surfeit locus protein 6 n=1 Tax=Phlyctema vagabunda TaxID=108571 RepID=A0ABR4PSU3_9HELO
MAESALRDRLRDYQGSFEGLMSIIPAKTYYGKDTSDQWTKKKQTKEEAAAARRAKLDPDSVKSAKDIMDERARKRKLEDMSDESDVEGVDKELPGQGLKLAHDKKQKKQKTAEDAKVSGTPKSKSDITPSKKTQTPAEAQAAKLAKAELKNQKQQRKKEKAAEKDQKRKQKKEQAASQTVTLPADEVEETVTDEVDEAEAPVADDETLPQDEMANFEADGLEEKDDTSATSPSPPSPTFENTSEPSTNTSTSSVVPPTKAPKHIKIPSDPELLKARLTARIEALRAARKADGPDGAPARNRQELMEARRKKEEQRRAHKKELRLKARAEEDAKREAALASARDSPASSMMSPAIHSPEENFSFGRVAFADGQQLTDDLSTLLSAPKKRGPQDPATAIQASEKKRLRIAGLDDEKRADIEEKDLWLNAKKRAHGEKVRDDTSLLKKTLKRKEKAKKKSEKEWGERKEGVAKGQAMKQKKREENLQKRKDGSKKGKAKVKAGKGGKPKVKSRPGFEGSFGSGGKRK